MKKDSKDKLDLLDEARKVLKIEADAVSALVERIGPDFAKALELIGASRGRVVVTGMGKSGLVGKKVAATLASTGVPSFFMHPAEAIHGDLGMVTSEDIVLAISSSGETEEVVGLVPYLKRFNVSLIALTGNPRSTLARQADAHIDVSVREEACSLGIVPTASTTAALAMGDAIAVTMLVKRGFSREDFASFHPGGAIGKKLLVKVSDLMHKGDDLPLVAPETSISDALLMMSSKRLGMTIVAGKDGRVEGVITDGDVRRGIEKWGGGFFGMASSEVMSLHPKTVDQDELAAKALATMEEHSITTLVVPDGDGRPVGVIHVHDILKKGIA